MATVEKNLLIFLKDPSYTNIFYILRKSFVFSCVVIEDTMRNIEEIQEIEKTVGTNRLYFREYCFFVNKKWSKSFVLMRCGHQPFCKKT